EARRRARDVSAFGPCPVAKTRSPTQMPRGRPRQEAKLVDFGKGWYIQYYDDASGETKRRSTGTRDRRQADRLFARWQQAQEENQRVAIAGGPSRPRHPDEITVAEVLTLYSLGRGPKLADASRIGYAIKHLLPWWTDARVSAILPDACEQYRDHRLKQGA